MSKKILVIDDNQDLCDFISAAANLRGWQCSTATAPAGFFEKLSPDTDLVLLDLMMPGMDGIEMLRLLGELQCKAGIVLISGVSRRVMETADELAAALGLFMVGHLQKPFRLTDLEEILARPSQPPAKCLPAARDQISVLDVDLRFALDHDEFVLHYQPQVEIATGSVIGVEALVRWKHPNGSLIFPDDFIPRIEALGWSDDLGWLVARRALAEVGEFVDAYGNVPAISINASVTSLLDLHFPDMLMDLAHESGVPAEKITIEITEGGIIRELPKTLDVLTRLRMKNVQISIDDFGTGYAMMQQLRRIPATELKIDRSFVNNVNTNKGDRVIVKKSIEIGHELGMTIVVEGIETVTQLDFLRLSGCDIAQGYFFSRPLAPVAMTHWLTGYRTQATLTA